jgi:hypothetical protein
MRKSLLIVPLLLVIGCTNIKYIGESYPPTSHVDIFFAEEDIERNYKVMGHADATAPEYVDVEKMMEKIKEKAMEKGADAVVVLGLDRNIVSESTEWSSETKVEKDKTTESGRQTTSTTKENEIKVLFIKYREAPETETEEPAE